MLLCYSLTVAYEHNKLLQPATVKQPVALRNCTIAVASVIVAQHRVIMTERIDNMHVITFNSEKGGTGKSTLATHLAGLAVMGHNVLLIDADPQGNATMSLGLRKDDGFYRLLIDEETVEDVARQVPQIIYAVAGQPVKGSLYYIPGNRKSYGINNTLEDSFVLVDTLRDLEWIDVVIIDTPPTPGLLMRVIYEATDFAIVPTQLELLSLDGLMGVLRTLPRVNVELLGIVPNMFRHSTAIHGHNLETLSVAAKKQNWRLFDPVGLRTAFPVASQNQRMVWGIEGDTKAAGEVWSIVEIVNSEVEQWDAAGVCQEL